MYRLALIYDSDKRYILDFEIVEKFVDKKTVAKIKTEALKEIQRL